MGINSVIFDIQGEGISYVDIRIPSHMNDRFAKRDGIIHLGGYIERSFR